MADTIKVLSYNIHKGFSAGNRKFVLSQIKESIQTADADLVFLQEVIGQHEKHGKRIQNWPTNSQFEFLAEKVWPHFAYGKNAVYTFGHHGNSILSRYPFSFWENLDISTNRFEKRGLLHGVIESPHLKHPLHVICIHLALIESWRQTQIKKLCRRINSHVPRQAPLLVAGDFNDWRGRITPLLRSEMGLNEAFCELFGDHQKTFPSWFPLLKLDRIYYRGFQPIEAKSLVRRPWRELSDHVALFAKLKMK